MTARGGLPGEHARLLGRVHAQAAELLAATARDTWPARELRALADCLAQEMLPLAAAEEAALFPGVQAGPAIARLGRDHRRLRAIAAVLARAAAGEGSRSLAQLAATTRDLLSQLERHTRTEQALLTGSRRG